MSLDIEALRVKIERLKKESFETHSTPGAYVISGGVEPHYTDKSIGRVAGYRQILPKLDGKDVIALIQEVIDSKGIASILDVGCGSAPFLNQCKNGYKIPNPVGLSEHRPGWREQVDCFGLNAYLYKLGAVEGRLPRDEEVEKARYQAAGIHILIGDAQQLPTLYPDQRFDVVTAVYVAEHLQDPWAFFYNMYGILDKNGVCLVRNLPFNFQTQEEENFIAQYLRDNYQAEVHDPHKDSDRNSGYKGGDIAIRKNNPILYLPLTYHDVLDTSYKPRIIYRVEQGQFFRPL